MKHKLTVNSIKSNGGDIVAENNIVRDEIESIEDISYETLITKRQALAVSPPNVVLSYYILNGEPDTYNFTEDDLAILNSLGRFPNFTAIISGDTFSDIVPHYDGATGFFASGHVKLHSDGNGNNLDTTYIQFS